MPQEKTTGRKRKGEFKRALLEFIVIVVGILLAFQVEEWREERAEQRDVLAALSRLGQETDENMAICERSIPYMEDTSDTILHVFRSLEEGVFINDDQARFNRGMILYDVVPDVHLHTSVAREMQSTGLLKEVDEPGLRGAIARLATLQEESSDLLSYWRTSIIELSSLVAGLVDFSFDGRVLEVQNDSGWGNMLEDHMNVRYEFQELAGHRRLRNLFFVAVDVHSDSVGNLKGRCNVVQEIRFALNKVLNG